MADGGAQNSQSWLGFLFSARGRISRKRYWLSYFLPVVFISIIAGIADGIIEAVAKARGQEMFSPIGALVTLFFLWPSFAVVIKRLHDRGMSGWWSLIANGFIPITILAVAAYWYWSTRMKAEGAAVPPDPTTSLITTAVCIVLALAWLYLTIVIMFVRGQEGSNQYGDDPLPTPEDVRSDRTVTAVFAVLTILFLFLPVTAYWYYASRMKPAEAEISPSAIEEVDEGSADASAPADTAAASSDTAPADGAAPVETAPSAEETAPPADPSPPPQ